LEILPCLHGDFHDFKKTLDATMYATVGKRFGFVEYDVRMEHGQCIVNIAFFSCLVKFPDDFYIFCHDIFSCVFLKYNSV